MMKSVVMSVEKQHGIELESVRESMQSNIQKMEPQVKQISKEEGGIISKEGGGIRGGIEGAQEESDDESALWGVEHIYAGSGSDVMRDRMRRSNNSSSNNNSRSVIEKFSTACPSHVVATTMCICFMVIMTLLGMVIFQATERFTLLNERYMMLNHRLSMLENRSYSFLFSLNHTQ
jgi:hypothetical protein